MTTPRAARPSRRLPASQPARAVTALACYLIAVAAAALILTSITDSPVAVLFSIGIGVLLLVPLAVLAPREPEGDHEPEPDLRPVLQRGGPSRTQRPPTTGANGTAAGAPGSDLSPPSAPLAEGEEQR